jgi:8-oxo-dGTP pyrophosphatase MutT (NUDIX family)
LRTSYEKITAVCAGRILVVDAFRLSRDDRGGLWDSSPTPEEIYVSGVPEGAILNEDPYAPVTAVGAAGGYLTRSTDRRRELLLIFRRGVWDLPKGKIDAGESIRGAALREVREELGIEDVHVGRSLGTTVHGYRHKGRFMVKTTHWMEMATEADEFHPEAEEGIERVAWFPWKEAETRLGYGGLRVHTRRIGLIYDTQ